MIRALILSTTILAQVAGLFDGSFVDRFGKLDESRWLVSDGWSNGDWFLNDWRRSQVMTGSSGLVVSMDKNSASKNGYSSGEIQTREVHLYGYYETRMIAARGSGVITGFFTYTGAPRGKPWNEIDVEILGKDTRSVQFTYHVGNEQQATTITLPFDAANEPHTFGFDWQPQYIRWYVDGKLLHSETGKAFSLPTESQQLFFDVWNSNVNPPWMGQFTWPGHPITAQVRCIAVAPQFPGHTLC